MPKRGYEKNVYNITRKVILYFSNGGTLKEECKELKNFEKIEQVTTL